MIPHSPMYTKANASSLSPITSDAQYAKDEEVKKDAIMMHNMMIKNLAVLINLFMITPPSSLRKAAICCCQYVIYVSLCSKWLVCNNAKCQVNC